MEWRARVATGAGWRRIRRGIAGMEIAADGAGPAIGESRQSPLRRDTSRLALD